MAKHPTRSAPKCADCQHLTRNDHCNHPSTRVDLITGAAAQSALYERQRANTPPYGKPADGCGPQGLNFTLRLSWRRRLLTALLTLAGATSLTACGGGDDSDPLTCYVDGHAMPREACR